MNDVHGYIFIVKELSHVVEVLFTYLLYVYQKLPRPIPSRLVSSRQMVDIIHTTNERVKSFSHASHPFADD